jgi:hypothetical protein
LGANGDGQRASGVPRSARVRPGPSLIPRRSPGRQEIDPEQAPANRSPGGSYGPALARARRHAKRLRHAPLEREPSNCWALSRVDLRGRPSRVSRVTLSRGALRAWQYTRRRCDSNDEGRFARRPDYALSAQRRGACDQRSSRLAATRRGRPVILGTASSRAARSSYFRAPGASRPAAEALERRLPFRTSSPELTKVLTDCDGWRGREDGALPRPETASNAMARGRLGPSGEARLIETP